MPTTLALSFPWGRYHANPWGRHVNEAAVEWPPSPWRILRALYATWKARAPNLEDTVVLGLLGKLATPPAFVLPDHIEAHTRHYMPDIGHGKDKAFDAFAVMERGAEVMVEWPVELDDSASGALAELASLLPYLGRAESVCQARLHPGVLAPGERCQPISWGAEGGPSAPVRVLLAEEPLDERHLAVRTSDVRSARLIDPPGSRWELYNRPEVAHPQTPVRRRASATPDALRWAIATPAPPSRRAAVAMADILRQACMSRYGKRFDGAASEVLAGKDAEGHRLSGHRHAHYLALDGDGDRLLDHLVLWAPAGFDEQVLSALAGLDRLTGFGHISDFRPARLGLEAVGEVGKVAPELVGPARVWTSHTPFSPPRHGKRSQTWDEVIEEQVNEELGRRGHPAGRVEMVKGDWLSYRRHRPTTERLEEGRRAAGVRIEFDHAVSGPLALGALSHFGLGLFVPEP